MSFGGAQHRLKVLGAWAGASQSPKRCVSTRTSVPPDGQETVKTFCAA
jgi:hypothetical protein